MLQPRSWINRKLTSLLDTSSQSSEIILLCTEYGESERIRRDRIEIQVLTCSYCSSQLRVDTSYGLPEAKPCQSCYAFIGRCKNHMPIVQYKALVEYEAQ